MARRKFCTPDARPEVIDRWRKERAILAIGALVAHGGLMRGTDLGRFVGVSPRGLAPFIKHARVIITEKRGSPGQRPESWYRLDPKAMPPECQAPPIWQRQKPRVRRINFKKHIEGAA